MKPVSLRERPRLAMRRMSGQGSLRSQERTAREGGFSLVQLMVALLISGIVMAGSYSAFNTLHRWWISTGIKADMRQNARIGLETVTRDLEMAGYHPTNYGDANKASLAVTLAASNEIEFDQQRLDIGTGTYEPRMVYYHLAVDANTGRQNLYRQVRTEPGLPAPDELVAENVAVFTLSYYGFGDPADAKNNNYNLNGLLPAQYIFGSAPPLVLRNIRKIDIVLETSAGRVSPVGSPAGTYRLTATVLPQNLEVTETVGDTVPPAVPTGLNVIDTRRCDEKLRVKWAKNTELDIAGYVIFYGVTEKMIIPVTALTDPNNPQIILNPADLLITKAADAATTPNTYDIQVAAYDSSGNYSARSAAVSGNPSPDVTAFGMSDDSTANPAKPSAPTAAAVNAGDEYGLVVSWQPPADGSAIAGYRLYRSETPFVVGAHIGDAFQVADESTLDPGVLTYTDSGLKGCVTYYYAVASVNCDETLVAGYLYNTTGTSDYAVASGMPQDNTPPPPPNLEGSVAGWRRAFITLGNPTLGESEDFSHTALYFSRDEAPRIEGGVVVGGDLVPDSDGGARGIFTTRGSQVIVFDSETVAEPSEPTLLNQGEYHILAVAYDRCGNTSADSTAIVLIELCGDDPEGAPPGSPSDPTFTSCETTALNLGWSYPPKNYTGAGRIYDFAGYRIERTGPVPGFSVQLTSGPTWNETWTDGGPLLEGGTYTYAIRATDCVYENRYGEFPDNRSDPLIIGPIKPGGLSRYVNPGGDVLAPENFVTSFSDEVQPYTYHNNVKFHLQNSSASPIAINKMSLTWENPNVVLDRVTIGGGSSLTPERTISLGGVASGYMFPVNLSVADVAVGYGITSGPIPVRLRFMTPSGPVNSLADLRGDNLEVTLWTRNESLQPRECSAPEAMNVEVPRGPVIGGFTQDAPGIFGIDSYAVAGTYGTARDTDMRVPSSLPVNVFGRVFDNSGGLFADGVNRGFQDLAVYAVTAAATPTGDLPVMPAFITPADRPLLRISGNRFAIYNPASGLGEKMPEAGGMVNWYYALAVDRTGNWDRQPDPDTGNYAYYTLPPDPCAATPRAPVLSGTTTPTQAFLTWEAPTHYSNGGPIPFDDPLTYDVYYRQNETSSFMLIPGAVNLTGTSYTHTADLLGQAFYYAVKAKNSCSTGPKVSPFSNIFRECEGTTGVFCSLFSLPTDALIGENIPIVANNVCMYQSNGHSDTVTYLVTSTMATRSFAVDEMGDSGTFSLDLVTVETGGTGANEMLAGAGTLSVSLFTADNVLRCTKTMVLTGGRCGTTPKPPTSFTATRGSSGSGAVTIAWVKPTYNTDNTLLTDLGGYRIDAFRCLTWNTSRNRCDAWGTSVGYNLDDPAAERYTYTGLTIGVRYSFMMQAKDTCPTVNRSAPTPSIVVNVR